MHPHYPTRCHQQRRVEHGIVFKTRICFVNVLGNTDSHIGSGFRSKHLLAGVGDHLLALGIDRLERPDRVVGLDIFEHVPVAADMTQCVPQSSFSTDSHRR